MAGHVNASWELPPTSWLNISDCDAVAPWMAYFYVLGSELSADGPLPANWDGGTPVNVVLDFLGSLVPNNWTKPTDGDLLLWYLDFFPYLRTEANLQTLQEIIQFAAFECGPKICPNLDFSGDSDLSGIGMVISYYMVAIFVTLYYLALVPGVFEAYGHPFKPSALVSRYRKFASGFEESVAGFLDAMLLFSISMLVAAITRYASLILHPDEPHSIFGLLDCVFLSTFSIFPALALQSLSYEERRRRVRLVMWDLVIAFAVTVEVLYRVEYRGWLHTFRFSSSSSSSSSSMDAQGSQMVWFAACQSESLRQSLQALLSVGHAVLVANLVTWLYRLAQVYLGEQRWVPALRAREGWWERWEACRLWLRLVNGLLCLAIMWAFLGLFTAYRHDVKTKAGEADEDDEWTFGQVLSLTTWIPIGIELISVYIYGAQETVQRGLSKRYKVVDREDARTQVIHDQVVYEKALGVVEVTPMDEAHVQSSDRYQDD
ncbi:hypothetical protein VSDG_07507 [Cytospora chrysosperma]|uniref:Uncharacterized protein n=1 Tax=Cytospora chrysosperma TaxID=252740 RepID=A0A423VM80_CYTCH|nr:hypothetical protein VSDG_07507 [Valsa sordida]